MIKGYKEFIIPCFKPRHPIALVDGKGSIVKDMNGREYIDCFSGIAVTNVGHCHPKVVRAIRAQSEKLIHCSFAYYNPLALQLAMKLAEIAPGELKKSFIQNSGAEANEGAIKLAKKHTSRFGIASLFHAFHGRTYIAASIAGARRVKKGFFGPLAPGVVQVPYPYCYRCAFKLEYPECQTVCATSLQQALEYLPENQVAAFIAEPMTGSGGVMVPPNGYFKEVKKTLDEYGIVFIADEVQTGLGRTGKMFAIEYYNVKPDIMTMAKALAGGMQLGAFIAREEVANAFEPTDHTTTFMGAPVSTAAALASIEVLTEEKLPERAAKLGDAIMKKLKACSEECSIVGDVRGKGFLIGVEIVQDQATKEPDGKKATRVLEKCRKRGVLIGIGGWLHHNVLRFKPPLNIPEDQLNRAIEVLTSVLREESKSQTAQ